jgi:hypothetical protein
MPSESGAGGSGDPMSQESSREGGSEGEGDSDSEWDEEASSSSECGDTGALPGGVGGMGQAGECIGGGASSADSDSSSESSAAGSDSAAGSSGQQGSEGMVQGTGGAGGVGEFPAESDAERAARLGQELEQSIGGFDEVLMEEQREISSVGRNTEGFGGGISDDGGISLGQQGSTGDPVQVANVPGLGVGSPVESMSEEEIRERTPEDIPVTADDDIIAKQLREAALAEEDPQLRERLWEEYRKYRGL